MGHPGLAMLPLMSIRLVDNLNYIVSRWGSIKFSDFFGPQGQ